MYPFKKHIIKIEANISVALKQLDELASDAILFAVDDEERLVGSLTDGDVRRALLKNASLELKVADLIQANPRFLEKENYSLNDIVKFRENGFRVLPVLNGKREIVNVINLRRLRSYLPVDVVIMAGGKGSRLRPLTEDTPKPLLKVGEKAIIEHNIDRLISFGIDDIWISINYLGEQIESYFGDGSAKGVRIKYVWEKEALGTIGAVKKISDFCHEYVLVTNSDLLTNLDYENFFIDFIEKEADISVVSIPYVVDVPYAVLETNDGRIHSFKEKPSYTYYSNGGIYLMKKEVVNHIPEDKFYNATDLLQHLINQGDKVVTYPLRGYWLDIGKPEDFMQAQEDIKHIKF
ncbi:MAG: nucleotidyltransferase family protein [Marinoscillum sp.]|uniref:nucleotidyltransferase family protein n=1 Tax=Marinoscillum sp. TaxID=2024838 RepID=UPI0032F74AD5